MTILRAICAVLLLALVSPAFAETPSGAPVQGVAVNSSTLNLSVTITSGNVFQQVVGSIVGTTKRRQSLTIQNNNTNTDNCWIYLGTTANATKATSILLAPGQAYTRYWPYVPSDAIQVTCGGTSDTVYADVQ